MISLITDRYLLASIYIYIVCASRHPPTHKRLVLRSQKVWMLGSGKHFWYTWVALERFGGWEMCSGHAFGVHYGFGGSETCWGDAFGVLGGPWGSLGSPLGSFGCLLGGPWASLEALGASWDRPGGPLGWFWRSGAILESVLGGQNVDISLVLDGFL